MSKKVPCTICGKPWYVSMGTFCFKCADKMRPDYGKRQAEKKRIKKASKFTMVIEEGLGPEIDPVLECLDRMIEEEERKEREKIQRDSKSSNVQKD